MSFAINRAAAAIAEARAALPLPIPTASEVVEAARARIEGKPGDAEDFEGAS